MNQLQEEWSILDESLRDDHMIRTWSYSRYEAFSKCKRRAKLLYIDRLEEPKPPLRDGQLEYANDRGTRIHEAAELYVKGGVELLHELRSFAPEFGRLRELYATGKVSLEGEWGADSAWLPVAFRSSDVWLRLKLDALVWLTPTHAVVIDYKTGRRAGNELKHAEQTQLYTVNTLMRHPEVERVTTELWYTDINDLARVEYTREQGMRFLKTWNQRGADITSCTEFPPNPNKYSCMYCRFGPGPKGSGVCPDGV